MAQHSVFSSNFLFKYFFVQYYFWSYSFPSPSPPMSSSLFYSPNFSASVSKKKRRKEKKTQRKKKTKIRQKTRGKWGNTEKLRSSFDVCQLLFLGMRPTLEPWLINSHSVPLMCKPVPFISWEDNLLQDGDVS